MSTTRRTFLASAAPVALGLTGTLIGVPAYPVAKPDLSAAAQAWLDDALDLGMWVGLGPDGQVYRGEPIHDGSERAEARDRHRVKLHSRPRLQRAVYEAVRRGYQPGVMA